MTATPISMLGLEVVRAAIELNIWDSLRGAGLSAQQVVYDNTRESPPALPYAIVSLSFSNLTADGMGGCGPAELITGAMNVVIHSAKGTGAGAGEAMGLAVVRGWLALAQAPWDGVGVRVVPRSMEGPRTVLSSTAGRESDRVQNSSVAVVAAAFSAQVA